MKQTSSNIHPSDASPNEYEVNNLLDFSKQSSKKHKRGQKLFKISMISCAVFIFGSLGLFTIAPAYAADIPVINQIVYSIAPVKTPGEDVKEKIADITKNVINDIYQNSLLNVGVRFKSKVNWLLNKDTLLAVYYLQYQAAKLSIENNGVKPEIGQLSLTRINVRQKAYKYDVIVNYDIIINDSVWKSETIIETLENTVSGLVITAVSVEGADFIEYKKSIDTYVQVNPDTDLKDEIVHFNAFLIGKAITEKNIKNGLDNDSTQTEEQLSMVAIATELRYRCYNARKTNIVPDLNDLVERNENTDLLFSEVVLQSESTKIGLIRTPAFVERGSSQILKQYEKDGQIIADIYVSTQIDGGIGEQLTLTFIKRGNVYTVTSYEAYGDGFYRALKVKANEFIKTGLTKPEANAKALLSELERIKSDANQ